MNREEKIKNLETMSKYALAKALAIEWDKASELCRTIDELKSKIEFISIKDLCNNECINYPKENENENYPAECAFCSRFYSDGFKENRND